jgi:nitronate monooxygenase
MITSSQSDLSQNLGLKYPLIVAPMAGGPSSVELVAACSTAGALGSMGAAYSNPAAIGQFADAVRQRTDRPFAINLFIPTPVAPIDREQIDQAIAATARYRDELDLSTPDVAPPFEEDFDAQFEAVLKAKPAVLSFVFGLLRGEHSKAARKAGIFLIGTATTLAEAQALDDGGVDAIALQGFEAGGHRGIFDARASDEEIPLRDLLAQCVGRVRAPLIAAGGIMAATDVDAALRAGAQVVQLGTAFLACAEAGTSKPYKTRLLDPAGRPTRTTRAFSGRLARGIENRFMNEMAAKADAILTFQAQNKFTRDIRNASAARGSADFLSLWAGTGEGDLWQGPAAELIERLFQG